MRGHFGRPDAFYAAIQAHVLTQNAALDVPLPRSECQAIARSIHRWIVTKSDIWKNGSVVYEETLSTIQSARSQRRRRWYTEVIAQTAD